MKRSHCFFRVVVVDKQKSKEMAKIYGAQCVDSHLDGGKMGVRGFLYFNFSVVGPDGSIIYPDGYARTREYADPDRPDNSTYVWSWRKDLSSAMCQSCSNERGGPVDLETNGCTKKKCSVVHRQEKLYALEAERKVMSRLEGDLSLEENDGVNDGTSPVNEGSFDVQNHDTQGTKKRKKLCQKQPLS